MSEPDFSEDDPGAQGKAAKIAIKSDSMTPANDAGFSVCGGCYCPANFQMWGKMPFWTPVEAACLSLGYDPVVLLHADDQARLREPEALKGIQFRIEIFDRAVAMGMFAHQIDPAHAIALLDSREEQVPPGLRAVVFRIKPYGKLLNVPPEAQSIDDVIQGVLPPESDALPAKLQKSYDILIAAMAIYGYGYDPASKRSDIGTLIADDIARTGHSLTPPVCADHVRASCKRLGIKKRPDADE